MKVRPVGCIDAVFGIVSAYPACYIGIAFFDPAGEFGYWEFAMYKIPYDATKNSLYHPGEAVNFFQFFDPKQPIGPATLCAEMARLAYVKQPDRLEAYLGRAGFKLFGLVGYDDGRGTQLFVAGDGDAPRRIVVAFRGTEPDDPSDIVSDAALLTKPWYGADHRQLGEVHVGFADALLDDPGNGNVLSQLKAQLDELGEQYPEARIYFTGHSLGAALATLTASCLIGAGDENKHVYTFGSPRVGDSRFAGQLPADKHDRFVNCCDLVTRVPPPGPLLDYTHTGTLRYIDRNGVIDPLVNNEDQIEDRAEAAAEYLLKYSYLPKTAWVRELADHSPINYLSGVAGLRA